MFLVTLPSQKSVVDKNGPWVLRLGRLIPGPLPKGHYSCSFRGVVSTAVRVECLDLFSGSKKNGPFSSRQVHHLRARVTDLVKLQEYAVSDTALANKRATSPKKVG